MVSLRYTVQTYSHLHLDWFLAVLRSVPALEHTGAILGSLQKARSGRTRDPLYDHDCSVLAANFLTKSILISNIKIKIYVESAM